MASLGHVAIGMAVARWRGRGSRRALASSMLLWSLLSLSPDADVIGFAWGVRYGDTWGHRGATHSFAFAAALGLGAGLLARCARLPALGTALTTALVLASHPLLDILTDGGRGCALFWPLSTARHFAPVRPIPVAPIGLGFLSERGLRVALVELALFSPLLLYAFWPRRIGARARESAASRSRA
jgi:inner membrane protein